MLIDTFTKRCRLALGCLFVQNMVKSLFLYHYSDNDMPKNVLFNFIMSQDLQDFEPKVASNGSRYFLRELPLSSESETLSTSYGELSITSHHVSVYSDMEMDSQYHYTADMVDTGGQKFKLHVYFNINDEATHVHLKDQQMTDCPLDKETIFGFSQMGQKNSYAVTQPLRYYFRRTLTDLQTHFSQLEIAASELSMDKSMQDTWVEKLHEMSLLLERLNDLVDHRQYQSIRRIIGRNFSKPQVILVEPQVAVEAVFEEPYVATVKPDSVVLSAESIQLLAQTQTIIEKASMPDLDAANATSLLSEINGGILLLEDNKELSPEHLSSLILSLVQHSLRVRRRCEDLLRQMVAESKSSDTLQNIQDLKSFHYILSFSDVEQAFLDNNDSLLDILCQTKHLNIDYPSAVLHCFKKGESGYTCLAVLLRNGASLLVPSDDGLPIAHHILSEQSHPFNSILQTDPKLRSQTIENPSFYKKLIFALLACPEQSVEIKRSVELYQQIQKKLKLKLALSRISPKTDNLEDLVQKLAALPTLASHIKNLSKNKEFLVLQEQCEIMAEKVIKALPPESARATMRVSCEYLEKLISVLQKTPEMTYQQLKESVISHLHQRLQHYANLQDFVDLNPQNKAGLALNHKQRKELKRLVDEIERFEKSMQLIEKSSKGLRVEVSTDGSVTRHSIFYNGELRRTIEFEVTCKKNSDSELDGINLDGLDFAKTAGLRGEDFCEYAGLILSPAETAESGAAKP